MRSNESEHDSPVDLSELLTKQDLQEMLERLVRRCFLLVAAALIAMLLASCSSLGKPERQLSNQPPSCNQREPALDSGDPPESTDWMEWAQAYVRAQWAVVDRDNKRAATADCLDDISRIK